jgi:hypothetical protein
VSYRSEVEVQIPQQCQQPGASGIFVGDFARNQARLVFLSAVLSLYKVRIREFITALVNKMRLKQTIKSREHERLQLLPATSVRPNIADVGFSIHIKNRGPKNT